MDMVKTGNLLQNIFWQIGLLKSDKILLLSLLILIRKSSY